MITLQSILDEIELKKQELDTEYVMDPGYEVCQKYLSQNRMRQIEDMMEIDPWGYITCATYLFSDKRISIDDAAIISDACKKMFDNLKYTDFDRILNTIIVLADLPNREDIFAYVTEPNKIHSSIILRSIPKDILPMFKITKGDIPDVELHEFLKELRDIEQKTGAYSIIYDFLKQESMCALTLFAFLHQHKRMLNDHEIVQHIGKKIKSKIVHEFYVSSYSFGKIQDDYNVVSRFVQEENQKKAQFEKTKRREIFYYDELKRMLVAADQCDEITNPREIIKHISDEDLKRDILIWIYQKNSQCQEKLKAKLEELDANSLNHYVALFKKNRISVDASKIPSIMHHSLNDVEIMLGSIPVSLFNPEQILSILQKTNVSMVQTIRKYIDLEFIQPRLLLESIDLYNVDGVLLKKLEESFALLGSYGVNQKLFSNSLHILCDDSNLFKQNIMYLSMYNLLRSLRSTSTYDFLLDADMVEKIDLFMELGYYSYLIQNLDLLNFSKQRIERLELLRAMNIPIDDINTLYEVLDNKKFIVKDDEINEYLLNVVPYKEPISLNVTFDMLKDVSSDGIVLSMGDSIISIPKIKRKMEEGMSLGESIFYGRRYSEEEYSKMVQSLSPYIRK